MVGWLLDRGPAELRDTGLVSMPLVLAYVVEHHVIAASGGLRDSYAALRSELGPRLSADRLTAAQQGIEKAGAALVQQCRHVALVRQAIEVQSPRLRG